MAKISLKTLKETDIFAEMLASLCKIGDIITLRGELGVGKTAFSRAFINAISETSQEVNSPTFTLLQTYITKDSIEVFHYDLYRLKSREEIYELGIDDAFDNGITLIEWPEIIEDLLPKDRLDIHLSYGETQSERIIEVKGYGVCRRYEEKNFEREKQLVSFLAKYQPDYTRRTPIAGDASFRRYERIENGSETLILMDAPPPKEDVKPFIKIANFLRESGLSAPEIKAEDTKNGFLLLEDFGDDSYSKVLAKNPEQENELYKLAVDVLVALHKIPLPSYIKSADKILTDGYFLLTDWYLPFVKKEKTPSDIRGEYSKIWEELLPLAKALPSVVSLWDYHADNLMFLADRSGEKKVGLLDFQDAVAASPAYDLVSLLEDLRRDVSPKLTEDMLNYYLLKMPKINKEKFLLSYAILGAQRNCKNLGNFARLAVRDEKPFYLSLIPRLFGYLENNLKHPTLEPLKLWIRKNL